MRNDGRFQNVAELTSARFLWPRHTEPYSPIQMRQFRQWLCWEVT
jgi:hypothetical protein